MTTFDKVSHVNVNMCEEAKVRVLNNRERDGNSFGIAGDRSWGHSATGFGMALKLKLAQDTGVADGVEVGVEA